MKLLTAYIIDGDVIDDLIIEIDLEIRELYTIDILDRTPAWNTLVNKKCDILVIYQNLKQHLKPAFPIVEEAFEAGEVRQGQICACVYTDRKPSTLTAIGKQDFLTKDFI